jgi:CRISPR/Cas system-associated exonuclease Cas4 (RecB family)
VVVSPSGKIDASVEMKVDRSGRSEYFALPLELKTGKQSQYNIGHQAQVILYTLLMSDRYGTIDVVSVRGRKVCLLTG